MTHEIHIKNLQGKNNFRKKELVLKVSKEEQDKEESSSSSSINPDEDEELAMLSNVFKG